jgi:hypothetical protein
VRTKVLVTIVTGGILTGLQGSALAGGTALGSVLPQTFNYEDDVPHWYYVTPPPRLFSPTPEQRPNTVRSHRRVKK